MMPCYMPCVAVRSHYSVICHLYEAGLLMTHGDAHLNQFMDDD
jgi:hypothetical protein